MVSTVPERVRVCVGSVRVCAQLDSERANTNPKAPSITVTGFMHLSLRCRIGLFGASEVSGPAPPLNRRFFVDYAEIGKFTKLRSTFPECVGEWSTGSRQISPDISLRNAP